MSNARLSTLADAGVSIWLDDVNREMLATGGLQSLVADRSVTGVTTNPTIFAAALKNGEAYREQLTELADAGAGVEEAVFAITTEDVRNACDVLEPVYRRTGGRDGRVSIEVDPRLARDAQATLTMASRLWSEVNRPNVMIKIPATVEGLPAVSAALALGISVNVTLIFSLDRYRGVMNAFLSGMEQARQSGLDLSSIHSVASFFVSRVDTEVDARLAKIGGREAEAVHGRAAVANARLAYHSYEEVFSTPRWATLADDGAHAQRPLWASTGVKNPDYPDTKYVVDLVAPNTVNTMPRTTLEAVADHGEILGDTVRDHYDDARGVLDALERLGVHYGDVVDVLERQGIDAFVTSWNALLETVAAGLSGDPSVGSKAG